MRRGIFVILALLAPLASACALNPPRIVSIAPGREATDVATNQAITISFDRAMNHESVEQRFGLSPALPGCSGSKNCHFAWSGNTLTFIHAHVNFDVSTAYQVSMHAGYADATGQQNGLEHSWRFVTEGRPALVAVDPSDNATAVAPDRNIVLSFSRPMLADSMRAAVQLSPDAPFLLRSKPGGDGAQFEIIPTAVLQPNQSYTLSVDRPVDTHENAIYGRVQTRFRTGSLGLSRKIGYLVAQPGQPAFAVGIVDPHADGFLGRSTPKIIYRLSAQSQLEDAILSFDWSPDAPPRRGPGAAQRGQRPHPDRRRGDRHGDPTGHQWVRCLLVAGRHDRVPARRDAAPLPSVNARGHCPHRFVGRPRERPGRAEPGRQIDRLQRRGRARRQPFVDPEPGPAQPLPAGDRKSTRLNSSHQSTSR